MLTRRPASILRYARQAGLTYEQALAILGFNTLGVDVLNSVDDDELIDISGFPWGAHRIAGIDAVNFSCIVLRNQPNSGIVASRIVVTISNPAAGASIYNISYTTGQLIALDSSINLLSGDTRDSPVLG